MSIRKLEKIKNILVTGGAGYVGSMLTAALIKKKYNVTVVDLMMYGKDYFKKNVHSSLQTDLYK